MPESQMIAPAKQTWEGSSNHKEGKNRNEIWLGLMNTRSQTEVNKFSNFYPWDSMRIEQWTF